MIWRNLRDVIGQERREQERAESMQRLALGMGIMAILGVATGILFAPKSGKETRREVREKAVDTAEMIKDTVQDKIEMMKDAVADTYQETSEAIKETQEKVESVKKDVQKAVKKA